MGVLSRLRSQIETRCLVHYRADPEVVRPMLPSGTRPAEVKGRAIVGFSYTRLSWGEGWHLPRSLCKTSEHLNFRIAVWFEDPAGERPGFWLPRRSTSSWLRARCTDRLLTGPSDLARFECRDDALSFRLRVECDGREEVRMRAHPWSQPMGSVFASARDAADFLSRAVVVRPVQPWIRDLDRRTLGSGRFVAQSLRVYELSVPALEDGRWFPAESLELDSAFRLVRAAQTLAPLGAAERALAVAAGAPPQPTA